MLGLGFDGCGSPGTTGAGVGETTAPPCRAGATGVTVRVVVKGRCTCGTPGRPVSGTVRTAVAGCGSVAVRGTLAGCGCCGGSSSGAGAGAATTLGATDG